MNRLFRNTWVEINLDQLEHNIRALKNYIGADVKLAPVIKGDAYGHGAVTIAEELSRLNVEYISVALISEAVELRDHNIQAPLLVLGYTENEYLGPAIEKNITLTIFEYDQAERLSLEAVERNATAHVHIKVDTGFHRLGKEPTDEFADEICRMSKLPNLSLEGIYSHLRLAGRETDRKQYELFSCFTGKLKDRGIRFRYCHISDSIAAVKYKEYALDMVRPGAIIYGYVPRYQLGLIEVKPIMTFKTKITRVQKLKKGDGVGYGEEFRADDNTIVATLAVGYADGYPRSLSGKGEVLIRNKRARVIGIVCMDQMMVDVSQIDKVQVGDEAILFGPEGGAPSAEELAALAGTNKNSIIAGISRRVPRVYEKSGSIVKIVDYLTNHGEAVI